LGWATTREGPNGTDPHAQVAPKWKVMVETERDGNNGAPINKLIVMTA
jgi:hypothetical protein